MAEKRGLVDLLKENLKPIISAAVAAAIATVASYFGFSPDKPDAPRNEPVPKVQEK